jgi:hypothetical protein
VTQSLGDIVEGIPALAIEHPIGNAVSERVRCHLSGGATSLETLSGRGTTGHHGVGDSL